MSVVQKAITRVGVVVSHGLNPKTVKVRVAKVEKNKQLRVMFNSYENYLVHDEKEACITGDVVRIEAGFRTSRHKKHVVNEIITPFGRPDSEVPDTTTTTTTSSSSSSSSSSTTGSSPSSTSANTDNPSKKKGKIIPNEANARRLLVESPKDREARITAERAEKLLNRIQKNPGWFRQEYPDVKIVQFENKRTQFKGRALKEELSELIRKKVIV